MEKIKGTSEVIMTMMMLKPDEVLVEGGHEAEVVRLSSSEPIGARVSPQPHTRFPLNTAERKDDKGRREDNVTTTTAFSMA
jgi:hypothetical protein